MADRDKNALTMVALVLVAIGLVFLVLAVAVGGAEFWSVALGSLVVGLPLALVALKQRPGAEE